MKKYLIYIFIAMLFVSGLLFEVYKIKPSKISNRKIKVYVVGEIKKEGVYELDEKSRIEDVIRVSGGLKSNADKDSINLAQRLLDGEKIVIKAKNINNDNNVKKNKINIHNLKKSDWKKIKGIGDKTSTLIINFLKENPSAKTEDLIKVQGISKSKVETIINYFNSK